MSEILEEQSFLDEQNKLTQEQVDYNLDYEIKSAKAKIADLQEEYKAAPSYITAHKKKIKFIPNEALSTIGFDLYEITGYAENKEAGVYISKDSNSGFGSAVHMNKYYRREHNSTNRELNEPSMGDDISIKYTGLNKTTIEYKDAKAKADYAVSEILGLENFSLCLVGSRRYFPKDVSASEWYSAGNELTDKPQRYLFIYTEVIDNIPILYYGIDTFTKASLSLSPEWDQHYLVIEVDDDGIYSIWENSTMTISDKLTENVELLAFEKIENEFRKYIALKPFHNTEYQEYDDDNPTSVKITIDDIRLGYVKIKEKDSISTQGILVPVWMFYGQQVNSYKSEKDTVLALDDNNTLLIEKDLGNPYLCINAIDGSIIDLTQGY